MSKGLEKLMKSDFGLKEKMNAIIDLSCQNFRCFGLALEGRKERLGSLFAFHHIGLLPNKLAEDLQAGGVNWFLFANDYKKVFEMKKAELDPNFTVEEALNIPSFHAINILNFRKRRQPAFLVNAGAFNGPLSTIR